MGAAHSLHPQQRQRPLQLFVAAVADSLDGLGRALQWQEGQPNQAEPLFQEAFNIRTNLLGAEHPKIAASLFNLGYVRSSQGRYAEAMDALLAILRTNRNSRNGAAKSALLALFVSHGISFTLNFLGRREYQRTTVSKLMAAPYGRIVMMQFTLIFGGWVVMLLNNPLPALVLLIVLKVAADLRAHYGERGVRKK